MTRLLLIVAMSESIHAARWMSMIRHGGWKIVLLPVLPAVPCPELAPFQMVRTREDALALPEGTIGLFDTASIPADIAAQADRAAQYQWPGHPAFSMLVTPTSPHIVATCIRALKPDLIHTQEVQLAGYITLEARRRLGPDGFAPWILSNWGSDIFLFRKLRDHQASITGIFEAIDGYWAECARDVQIAREHGFSGAVLPPMPASGGMTITARHLPPPSQRELIYVKGYHGWAGRGLHILSAIYLAAAELKGLRIRVGFTGTSAVATIDEISRRTGLDIAPAPYVPHHRDALARLEQARLMVGLGISDGISTTLLEAMSVGAFPILANTTCACEWVRNGRDGLIVNPHDTAELARALARAAADDDLVDQAARRNFDEVSRRWNPHTNGPLALKQYDFIVQSRSDAAARARAQEPLP